MLVTLSAQVCSSLHWSMNMFSLAAHICVAVTQRPRRLLSAACCGRMCSRDVGVSLFTQWHIHCVAAAVSNACRVQLLDVKGRAAYILEFCFFCQWHPHCNCAAAPCDMHVQVMCRCLM
jgi:hypothetical protein